MILLAEDEVDLQRLVELTSEFYTSVGLSANSNKSFTLGCASQIYINYSAIGTNDRLRYLGVTLGKSDTDNRLT